ncbi:MAG: DinB family protein [Planctomycetota bacterium]|jgi:uncharacterized damage-inducible protein DinB
MFTREGLLELHGRGWKSLMRLLRHAATLPPDELLAPVDGFGHGTVRDTLVHIAESEDWWISTAQGKPSGEWNADEFGDMDPLRDAFHGVGRRTREYLEGLSDEALEEPVEMRHSGGSFQTAPAWIVLHMVTHAFHHKGQIASMCRALGHPAPDTDLDVAP